MLIYLLIMVFLIILIMQISSISKEGFSADDTSMSPVPLTSANPIDSSSQKQDPVMAPVTGQMDPSLPSRVSILEQKVSDMSAQVNVLTATSNKKYTTMEKSPTL